MPRPERFRPYTRPKSQHSRRNSWFRRWFRALVDEENWIFAGLWQGGRHRQRHRVENEFRERYLNRPLLVGGLVAVVVLLAAGIGWHRWQVERLSQEFLARINAREAQKDWLAAAEWCLRLSRLRPRAADVRVRLAKDFERVATSPAQRLMLAHFYRDALVAGAESPELHRQLAELWSELGRHLQALEQAEDLLAKSPDDPAGWRYKARAMDRLASEGGSIALTDAAKALERAIELNPHDVPLAVSLAEMYRARLNDPGPGQRNFLANRVVTEMIRQNQSSAPAYLARYHYLRRYGLPGADADLAKALDLDPRHLPSLLAAAEQALLRNRQDDAIAFYRRATAAAPQEREPHLGLGDALTRAGQVEAALAAWQTGLTERGGNDPWLSLRITDALLQAGRLPECRTALAALDEGLERALAGWPPVERSLVLERRNYDWARWYLARGDYRSAVPLLRQVMLARETRLTSPQGMQDYQAAIRELAACYFGLDMPDMAAATFEAAVRAQPTSAEHHLAAGDAWLKTGRLTSAVEHLKTAAASPQASPQAHLRLVQARLRELLRVAPAERNWSEFDAALARAKQEPFRSEQWVSLAVAEADGLAARQQPEAALELLHTQAATDPGSRPLLEALILAEERWGRSSEADRWLERYEQRVDDSAAAVLMRVNLLVTRSRYRQAIPLLTSMLAWIGPDRRPDIQYRLAMLHLEGGNYQEGMALLFELVDEDPKNTQSLMVLAQNALESGNVFEAERDENLLYEVEKRDGTLWRYVRAGHQLLRWGDAQAPTVAEAAALQERIETLRPAWGLGHLIRGGVAERQAAWGSAIQAYERAHELGGTGLLTVGPLVRLWYLLEAPSRAERYFVELDDRSLSRDIFDGQVDLSWRYGKTQRAIPLARQALARDPGDPVRLIRLGTLLAEAWQQAEAELVLRRATQLAPDDPTTWLALSRYYGSIGFSYAAIQSLAELAGSNEVDAVTRSFTLGRAYERIDEFEQAAVQYRYAAAQAPDDLAVQRKCAAFFLARDPVLAEHLLRRILTLDPGAVAWRRQLARLLARRGDPGAQSEAFTLLTAPEGGLSSHDLRLTARALAGYASLGERRLARDLLVQAQQAPEGLPPDDQFLLAQLFLGEGQLSEAQAAYAALVSRIEPEPAHVAGFVELLLSQGRLDLAEEWFSRLSVGDRNPLRLLRLEARLVKARDASADVERLVENRANAALAGLARRDEQARFLLGVAEIYQRLGLTGPAERSLRRVIELDPPSYPALANLLTELDRAGEAVDLCLQVAQTDYSAQAITVLGQILASGRTGSAEVGRVEPVVMSAFQRNPRQAELQFTLGMVRFLQGRNQEAIDHFRGVINLQPDHVPARHQLALLLSHSAQTQTEAGDLIAQALTLAGPQHALRDTQALVLLRQGRVDESLAALRTLVGEQPAAAACFHWALAAHTAGLNDEARRAARAAVDQGLIAERLPPLERLQWTRLAEQLGAG